MSTLLRCKSGIFVWLPVMVVLLFVSNCQDTEVYVDGSCERDPRTGKRDYRIVVGVSRSFSAAPPTRAQIALLLPTTWSGLATQTQNLGRAAFVHNGTTLVWSSSSAVATKADAKGSPHSPSFAWVGFETNEYLPDPSIMFIAFAQLLGIVSAPEGDLDGVTSLQVFVGDINQDNDRMPSGCPTTFHLGSSPVPTLSLWGVVRLLLAPLSGGAYMCFRRFGASGETKMSTGAIEQPYAPNLERRRSGASTDGGFSKVGVKPVAQSQASNSQRPHLK